MADVRLIKMPSTITIIEETEFIKWNLRKLIANFGDHLQVKQPITRNRSRGNTRVSSGSSRWEPLFRFGIRVAKGPVNKSY